MEKGYYPPQPPDSLLGGAGIGTGLSTAAQSQKPALVQRLNEHFDRVQTLSKRVQNLRGQLYGYQPQSDAPEAMEPAGYLTAIEDKLYTANLQLSEIAEILGELEARIIG